MDDGMRLNPDRLPLYKLIAHVTQIVFSFIAWVLSIVVFRSKDASATGSSGWAFAVCFLSVPGWIYLIGAPRYPRTRRFANPYAMVAVDILYFIMWLSAFAAQASYNSSGKCGHGCGTSKGVVALGVLNTLLFGVTTFLSLYTVKYYQFHGELPGYERLQANKKGGGENIDPDMAAFSTNLHDDEPYARVHDDDADAAAADYGHEGGYDYHGSAAGGATDYGDDSTAGYGGSAAGYGGGSTSYGGGGSAVGSHVPLDNPFDDGHGLRPAASAASLGSAAGHSAYAPPTAYDADERVRFPDADYNRH